ncbi:hypothetical protein [Paenibacillus tepidiphilus]|uniref:hypothetical protein n=1 Tax=Paenibacillus tepidiphilus TaxID=2608683 RepID=UPI001238C3AB|nr:hypothetical protein [Paenibacillus tepidiphilus]
MRCRWPTKPVADYGARALPENQEHELKHVKQLADVTGAGDPPALSENQEYELKHAKQLTGVTGAADRGV